MLFDWSIDTKINDLGGLDDIEWPLHVLLHYMCLPVTEPARLKRIYQ